MPLALPDDLAVLVREAIAASSQAAVARRCKISAAALSQLLSGTYAGSGARILTTIKAAFNGVDCPHTGTHLTLDACHGIRTRAMPQSSAPLLAHWLACQRCPIFNHATGARAPDALGASNAPKEVA